MPSKVTKERFGDSSYYRLQVDAGAAVVAFCYNAMVLHYGSSRMRSVRNRLAKAAASSITGDFIEAAVKDQQFHRYLRDVYYPLMLDDEVKEQALAFWEKHGLRFRQREDEASG